MKTAWLKLILMSSMGLAQAPVYAQGRQVRASFVSAFSSTLPEGALLILPEGEDPERGRESALIDTGIPGPAGTTIQMNTPGGQNGSPTRGEIEDEEITEFQAGSGSLARKMRRLAYVTCLLGLCFAMFSLRLVP